MHKINRFMERLMLVLAIVSAIYVAYLFGSNGIRTSKDYFIVVVPFFAGLSFALRRTVRLRREREEQGSTENK